VTEQEPFIKQCHELAISAGKRGNHTFGALLVHNGKVIMTAENSVNDDRDDTRHAELNLIVKAQREYPTEVLQVSTLYTSTAPCLMCSAVIWNAGITKIVYSVSYEAFARLIPGEYRYMTCHEVYERLGTPAHIIGPVLETEGLEVFKYWEAGGNIHDAHN
jgi:tRNA(Arg) A34 adenosine deaminase TadA